MKHSFTLFACVFVCLFFENYESDKGDDNGLHKCLYL